MIGIAINKQKLHEVKMLMVPYSKNTISSLQYPKHRISFDIDCEKNITLLLPSKLVIELYKKKIIPVDTEESVTIHISGEKIGDYYIDDLRYPHSGDEILIKLKKKTKKIQQINSTDASTRRRF